MAVASDLPQLEDPLKGNSVILDANGKEIGLLTGNQRQLYVSEAQISPLHEARDHRDRGPPLLHQRGLRPARHRPGALPGRPQPRRGAGRLDDHPAVRQERHRGPERPHAVHEAARGGAGLPPHAQVDQGADPAQLPQHDLLRLRRLRRSSPPRARTSAANHTGCETDKQRPCAAQLDPARGGAAGRHGRLAQRLRPDRAPEGVARAAQRRAATGCSTRASSAARSTTRRSPSRCPTREDISPPREDTKYPYFTSWVKQQVVDKLGGGQVGARTAFTGGLTVKTTLDSKMQDAADPGDPAPGCRSSRARARRWSRSRTRPARCGRWWAATTTTKSSFNLATQGQRQPGSSFKPFVLAEALRQDISPGVAVELAQEGLHAQGGREVHGQQLQRRVRRHDDAGQRDDQLRQLRLRGARAQARPAQGGRDGAAARRAHAGVAQRGQRARRPQAGRDAAGHGPRLRDVRAGRQAHLRHAQPGRAREPPRHADPRPGRRRGDRPRQGRRLRAARARRHASSQNRVRERRVISRRATPGRSSRSCRRS